MTHHQELLKPQFPAGGEGAVIIIRGLGMANATGLHGDAIGAINPR